MPGAGRLWRAAGWLALAAAYPLWTALFFAFGQIGLARTAGLAAAAAAALAVLALPVAAAATWLGRRPAPRRDLWLRAAFLVLAAFNGLLIGMAVFGVIPRPKVWLVVAAILLAIALRYLNAGPAARAIYDAALDGLGRLLVAAPVAALPWVALEAWRTPTRFDASPAPLAGVPARPDAPRRIVVLTFDALRARSVDLAGPAGRTPAFAALARRATTFGAAKAASNGTQQSVLTLLTGVRPHRIVPLLGNRRSFVRQGAVTGMAAHLAPAGYRARYATMLVNPGMFGVREEFEGGHWYMGFLPENDLNARAFVPLAQWAAWALRPTGWADPAHTRSVAYPEVAARDLLERARRELRAADGRIFMWLHVGAPHEPYVDVPAGDFGKELRPTRYKRIRGRWVGLADAAKMREYEAVYERYVAYLDHELGRFVAGMEADGTWDDALVVVTADHGEQFVVGEASHGHEAVTEDVAAVPLVIKAPGQRAPARVDRPVGTEDLLPTVLAQVYGRTPPLVGRPLLPAPDPAPRTIYLWARLHHFADAGGPPGAIAAYRDRFKYVADLGAGREALFDLRADPAATRDVAAAHPEVVAAFRADARRDGLVEGP